MPKDRSGFHQYARFYRKNEQNKGRTFINGHQEVLQAAGYSWNRLSRAEKAQFEDKAARIRARAPIYTIDVPVNNLGIPIADVEIMQKDKELAKIKIKNTITEILDDLLRNDMLNKAPFYALSFNYFYKTLQGRYYPAEMGMVRFSISSGITKKIHQLINPGKLPLGSAFRAKDHAECTHRLPVPPNALGETNLDQVMCNLYEFISEEKTVDRPYFPILVLEEEMPMVKNIISQLCEAGEIEEGKFVLLPVDQFFSRLRAYCEINYGASDQKWTEFTATLLLERDEFLYSSGIGCEIHEKEFEDVVPDCAMAKPTRWAYIILKHVMGICEVKKPKPLFHFPVKIPASGN